MMNQATYEFEERLADLVLEFQAKGANIPPPVLEEGVKIDSARNLYNDLVALAQMQCSRS